MKLIDVSVLKEWVENWFTKNRFYHPYAKNNNIPITELYDILEQMPSAQPEVLAHGEGELSAQPKTGKWQITDAYPHNVYCSECHKRFAQTHWSVWEDGSLPRNFCPSCGADMRGEKHD